MNELKRWKAIVAFPRATEKFSITFISQTWETAVNDATEAFEAINMGVELISLEYLGDTTAP